MKFTCDQCHAQYMIADEKVGDKGVKVKCKKCAHIIIVRPAAAAEPDPPPEEAAPPAADPAAPAQPPVGFETNDTVVTRKPAFGDGSLPEGSGGAGAEGAPASDSMSGASGGESAAGFGAGAFAGDQPSETGAGADAAAATQTSGAETDPGAGLGAVPNAAAGADAGAGAQPAASAAAPEDQQIGGAFDSLFGGGAADGASAGDGGSEAEAPAPMAAAGPKEWYVAIDDSQVGPIDIAEIEQRWDAREIDEDSLAWKTGMDDWLPVAEIPELAYLVTERPHEIPGAAAAPTFGGMAMAGGGLAPDAGGVSTARPAAALGPVAFGGGEEAPDVDWKPSAASALDALVQEELVSSEPEAAPESSSSAVPDGMPSFGGAGPGAGNGGTAPAPDPAPAPSFAPAAGSFVSGGGGFAVPEPRPSAASGGLKPIHLILTVVALAVLGLVGVLVWKILTPPTVVAQAPAAVAQPAMQPVAPVPSAPVAVAPGSAAAPTPAPAPAAAPPKEAAPKKGGGASKGGASKGGGKKGGGKKGGGKRGGGDSLDDVFDEPRKSAKPSKAKLTRQDIVGGVKKNIRLVMPCLKTARSKGEIVPGTYKLFLDWKIKPDGSVTGGRLTGPSKVMGTSLPACFARKMRGWSFPSSRQGAPVSNFPFGPFTIR